MKMKWKAAVGTLLIFLLVGCGKQPASAVPAVQDTAYQWEKAYMDRDYDRQQALLYEKGTFEVNKTTKKIESGLKKQNIRYEIYYDKEFDWYYVLTEYINPLLGNTVEDKLVIRKKGDSWKVDMNATEDISRQQIQDKFQRIACVNCK